MMKNVKSYEANQLQSGLLLNANENPNNLSDELIDKVCQAMKQLDFNRYPDSDSINLRQAYAKYLNLNENQIIAGNGSDELLGLLINIYLGKDKKVLTLAPDFSMYDYYATMQAAKVIKFDVDVSRTFDVDAFIQKGKDEAVDMILFSNPNNPMGNEIERDDIIKIIQAFPNTCVVVDEAYGDFGTQSMVAYIDDYDNLLITRTLSKAFGLAGIRCGFLLGNASIIQNINAYKVPYNVNALTQTCACVVLEDIEAIKRDINNTKQLRDEFYEAYQLLNLKNTILYRSNANYIYGTCKDLKQLKKMFEEEKIIIRYYDDSFRISIGNDEDNKRVLKILELFG